ncbi:MAG: serine hydrolase [Candidatus Lutacidiplasmatales archaeon]
MTGGELLARTLARLEVEHFFYLIGGPMADATRHCLELGLVGIDVRHEQAAAMAAHAYARVSGRPFGTFLRERLFEPLGMRDTGFAVPPSQIGRFTTEYESDPVTGGSVVRDPAEGGEWSRPPEFPSGAAGLVSTVDDYHAFAKMLLGGESHEGKPLLSRRSVVAMTTDHLTEAQRSDPVLPPGFFGASGWGYGVSIVIRAGDPTEPVGSYGWSGGLGTLWSNDPRADSVTILLTQRMSDTPTPSPVVRDFVTLAHRAIVG